MQRETRWSSSCTPNLHTCHSYWIVNAWYTSQPARGALIDGHTEMPCIGRVYIHTVHSVHEETSPAFNYDFLNCRVFSFLLTSENVTQDTWMGHWFLKTKRMGHWDFSRNYKFSYMGPKPTNILTWSSTFKKSRHMLGRFNNGEQQGPSRSPDGRVLEWWAASREFEACSSHVSQQGFPPIIFRSGWWIPHMDGLQLSYPQPCSNWPRYKL
jgi:hypothetical protein